MGKYTPLGNYLSTKATSEAHLTFAEVEHILEAPLPPSAHVHREWWANDATGFHPHATEWLAAGWKVEAVSLVERWVRFERAQAE